METRKRVIRIISAVFLVLLVCCTILSFIVYRKNLPIVQKSKPILVVYNELRCWKVKTSDLLADEGNNSFLKVIKEEKGVFLSKFYIVDVYVNVIEPENEQTIVSSNIITETTLIVDNAVSKVDIGDEVKVMP